MNSTDHAPNRARGTRRPGRAQRRDDVELVTSYHQAQLRHLLEHLRDGFHRYEQGELDAFELDAVIHQYTGAARELWKFCGDLSGAAAASTARVLREMRQEAEQVDWWERARPRTPG
jgi:hypothetical protein